MKAPDVHAVAAQFAHVSNDVHDVVETPLVWAHPVFLAMVRTAPNTPVQFGLLSEAGAVPSQQFVPQEP